MIKKVTYCLIGIYIFIYISAYLFQKKFIFHPVALPVDYKFDFELPFEEIWFKTEENVKLNALHFKADSAKGVILYFHGNTDNLVRWGKYAGDFTKKGYDVIMMDYRTYGKSSGDITNEMALHNDAEFIYQQIVSKYKEKVVVVYGRSLGTGIAAHLAVHHQPKMLILETPYYNMKTVANHYFPLIPYDYILHFPLRTDTCIQKVNCPVYIFHGTYDQVVPYSSGEKLAALLHKKNILFTIRGGEHKNLNTFPQYHQHLSEILE